MKKLLSSIVIFAMLISVIPITAIAEEQSTVEHELVQGSPVIIDGSEHEQDDINAENVEELSDGIQLFTSLQSCGDGVTWSMESDGTLRISGNGNMEDYTEYNLPPWGNAEAVTKLVIDNGVTGIGSYAFYGCNRINRVTIPKSVAVIGSQAFYLCESLESVTFESDSLVINYEAFWCCDNITEINFVGDPPQEIDRNAFSAAYAQIYYPKCISSWDNFDPYYYDLSGEFTSKDFTVHIEARDASCSQDGVIEHWYCSACNKYFSDNNHTIEIEKVATVISTGHDFIKKNTVEPKCSENGYTVYECSKCGEIQHRDPVTKPHDYEILNAVTVSCTQDGKTEGKKCRICGFVASQQEIIQKLGHDYSVKGDSVEATCYNQGYTVYKCSRCDSAENRDIIPASHTTVIDPAVEPTCNLSGYTEGSHCEECRQIIKQQEELPSLGHVYAEYVRTQLRTCTTDGFTEYKCIRCNATEKQSIIPASHTEVEDSAVESGCTESGKTAGSHCSVCGVTIIEQEATEAKGHDYSILIRTIPSNCETDGYSEYKCSRCDATEQRDIVQAGHKPVTVPSKAATCTSEGLTEGERCSACGETITEQLTITALGHDFSVKGETSDPTCTSQGYTAYKCTRCEETENRDFTEPSHSVVIDEAVEATCTAGGYTEGSHCEKCNKIFVLQDVVSATGHKFNVVYSVVEPSCTTDGYTVYKCEKCEKTETRNKVPARHTVVKDEAVSADCFNSGLTEGSHCSVCNAVIQKQQFIPIRDHDFRKNLGVVEAGCTEDGYTLYGCLFCDETEKRDTTKAGHKVEIDREIPAGCLVEGLAEGRHCSKCGEIFVPQEKISAKGHSVVTDPATAPTAYAPGKTEGSHCSACGEIITAQLELAPETTVEISGFDAVSGELWVNGVKCSDYTVIDADGKKYIDLGCSDVTCITSFTYGGSGTDVHQVYPVGMKVWLPVNINGSYVMTYIPEFDDLLKYSGSSIRITGVKGIRMLTGISQNVKDSLISSNICGYTLEEYGTVLAWANQVSGESLTLESAGAKSNYAYKRGVVDPVFASGGGTVQYTNVLVGFNDEQCAPDIVMRPYIKLTDERGQTVTVYGGAVQRSIGYIAYQNRSVFSPGSSSYEYVWNIIHHVYGSKYDAEYKG